jgi:hypothetical protein
MTRIAARTKQCFVVQQTPVVAHLACFLRASCLPGPIAMDANAHLRCVPTAADDQALLRGRRVAHLTRPRAKRAPSANRALPVSLALWTALPASAVTHR